jgi:uncharacterized protein YgiM (DUF1202 family)
VVQSQPRIEDDAEQAAMPYAKTTMNLREGPGTKFAVITVVPKGLDVSVMEAKGHLFVSK